MVCLLCWASDKLRCDINLAPWHLFLTLNICYRQFKAGNMIDYMCDECSYKTDRSDNLKRHKRIRHSNAGKIKCDNCSKLLTEEVLIRHKKSKACKRRSIQQSSIEVLPSDNIKIPQITAEIWELADGSTSIKHDRIVIDGISFLFVPESVALEAINRKIYR